ncbi:MAG: sodium:proton antiporter [Candidatus Tectimicrobiota bacterium]|nr:MAG: sodium:proton antiporter [Candidatus Tectomicrobia bacterium]
MHPSVLDFAFAAALLAAAAVVVHRCRFPALPAYLLVGLGVGTRLDVASLEPLPSLGLLLLLFSVGLEFGPDRLAALSGRVLRAGGWDALGLLPGLAAGLLLGLDFKAAVMLAGVLYVSSSAVIAKLIIDLRRAAEPESEVVLGVLVFEDLVIAVLLALVGSRGGPLALLASVGLVGAYLLAAHYFSPRLAAAMEALPDEPMLLLGAAFTAGTAMLFHAVGASEGIGAFLAGVIAAGMGLRERILGLFTPVRDLAVAFFFLTVGVGALALLADLQATAVWLALAALVGKLPLDYLAGAAAALGLRRRLLTALYLIPRGEFNLVLGALALREAQGLISQVAVLLVLITIPLGAVAIRFGPAWTAGLRPPPRRLPAAVAAAEGVAEASQLSR